MKLLSLIKFSLVLCFVGITASQGMAFTNIGDNWRSNYPDACQELQDATTNAQNCILCHTSGFGFNPYGRDLKEANNDFALIESMDSDGDGRTNGDEINLDCTLPGNPVSPVEIDSWGSIKVLFR